ncbi:MAG: DNA repair ATPase RecN [Verrucomicrobiales bacterium]|jgi:DNA repair ATPase RecN
MQNLAYPSEKEETLLNFDQDQDLRNPTQPYPPTPKPEFAQSAVHTHHYEVEDKVKRAEEQLAALHQKRELLEHQKQELQNLSARRHAFNEGKNEVVKVLTEALPELREEAEEAQRRSEFLRQMREVFGQHLEVLKTMNPDDWDEVETKVELDRGATALEEAKIEIERFEERLGSFADPSSARPRKMRSKDTEFARWMKMGFAFALPIMIFAAITLVVTYLVVTQ